MVLAAAEQADVGTADESRLFLKFKALIFLHPEVCGPLGKMLTRADPRSLTMRVLTGALEAVGNDESEEALVNAIRFRPEDWPALSFLIPALGTTTLPSPATEAMLSELAFHSLERNIASTAQLALGSLSRRLAENSPERSARIVRRFLQVLGPSKSSDENYQTLLVLGNAGSAEALPAVLPFASDPSPRLRGAALWALRWIDTPAVDARLAEALTSDREPSVRAQAASALRFRRVTAETFRVQEEALLHDTATEVRAIVLPNLWAARQEFPKGGQLVRWAAANGEAKEVQDVAIKLLENSN